MLRGWLLFTLAAVCALHSVQAQINLVPNPSFEEYDTCYTWFGDQAYPKYWTNPTTATPDYHNAICGDGSFYGAPQNAFGYQYAKTGIGYIGMHSTDYTVISSGGGSSEYFQCRLLAPLKGGAVYKVSFYTSLADRNKYACDNIGVYFSDTAIWSDDAFCFDLAPSVVSPPKMPTTDKENWVEISGQYIANGGEEYLTIGMLSPFDSVYSVVVDSHASFLDCYYYFDDVSVVEVDITPFRMPNAFTPNSDGINDTFYPIFFDPQLKINDFRVYNVWGELVHNNPLLPWDGTFHNVPQSASIYTYYIFIDIPVPDIVGEKIAYRKTGSITLIR